MAQEVKDLCEMVENSLHIQGENEKFLECIKEANIYPPLKHFNCKACSKVFKLRKASMDRCLDIEFECWKCRKCCYFTILKRLTTRRFRVVIHRMYRKRKFVEVMDRYDYNIPYECDIAESSSDESGLDDFMLN